MKRVQRIYCMILVMCMISALIALPVHAEDAAEIVSETTNAAPTGSVPMYETLKVSVTGATPTGYQWKYKNSATGTTYNGGTEASYRVPSNYVEMSGDCLVWCEVTYAGGTVSTAEVTMSKDYTNQVPIGYDNMVDNKHYKSLSNAENSNPDYVFYVDGKGFVVANERNVQGSAYFVVALDAYGDIYNGDNTPSATAWKNYFGQTGFGADGEVTMQTKLLGEGNTYDGFSDESGGKYALPDVFDNYIDMDHSWPFAADKYGTVKELKSGVFLLSYGDYVNYSDRIGYKDSLYSVSGSQPTLLRDLYFTGTSSSNHPAGRVISSNLITSQSAGPYLVRPCFWLEKDFFEKNAIDLSTAGSGIIGIMKNETFTNKQTLKDTYTAAGKLDEYNEYFAELTAEIVSETTNAAPTGSVPMYETLKVSVTGATPTGYQWKYKNSATGTTYNGGTEASYRVPSNYVEMSGDCLVWCEVTYAGGTVSTAEVTMSKDYTNQVPIGYDNMVDNKHYKSLSNAENSNPDYVFYVDGKGFVVANERNVQGSAYFVVALDAYGDIYNGDNTPSATAWKNYFGQTGFGADGEVTMQTKLLGEGNTYDGFSDESGGKYALPDVFDNYIDMDHSWPFAADKYGTVKELKSGVFLLSYGDYVNYSDRIGYKDSLYSVSGSQPTLLRDLYFTGTSSSNHPAGRVISSNLITSQSAGPYLVRPCFWLEKDFFEKNAIDLSTAGSGIIGIMKNETFTNKQTLKDTYVSAGRVNDYDTYLNPDISFEISVRGTNAAVSEAKLYDTLYAKILGVEGEYTYTWEVYESDAWTEASADIANGAELALVGSIAGKKLRVVASCGASVIKSSEITAPNIEEYTEVPGSSDAPRTLSNPENSAAENIFTVDGRGFVLLEAYDNDAAAYYVTATDSYGTANNVVNGERDAQKKYNAYGQFDGSALAENIMGAGNDYGGFIGADDTKVALPSGVSDNIYTDTVWGRYVASGWAGAPYWVSATVSGPVQMLSQTDFEKYSDILGWRDNVFAQGGDYYLLRDTALTAGAWYHNSAVGKDGKTTQADQAVDSENGTQTVPVVRPAFYLKADFFKNVKLDNLSETGSKILDIMRSRYYADDLAHLYDKATLRECGFKYRVNMTPTWTDKNGNAVNIATASSLKVSVDIENSSSEDKSAVLMLAVYSGDGRLIAVNMTADINIPADRTTNASCTVDNLRLSGETGVWASAMLWDGLATIHPVTASVEL